MPDTPFTTHKHDELALNRNVAPIPECRVVPVLQNGKVIKAVDVKILSCASVWLRCQQEAERWISDCDGEILQTRPQLMNARINSAYAYLWLTDRRFQWAGLAAFASKQVGCGLLHSAEMVAKGKADGAGLLDRGAGFFADRMRQRLALCSRSLFLEIYPLHRFYTLRSAEGMRKCLDERQLIRDKVKWEVKEQLPFGLPFKEIRAGFDAIDRGDVMESVRQLVWHEQVNVLQPILYNDVETRALLDANQAVWVTELPSSGYYQEVQLTLSAQCKPTRDWTNWFNKSLAVKLYDQNDRMAFVYRAVEAFDKLVRKRRAEVERSMREIFVGHAIR
jgi:hypothetical protein